MYQQQKRYNTAMDKFIDFNKLDVVIEAGKDWRGSGSLKLHSLFEL